MANWKYQTIYLTFDFDQDRKKWVCKTYPGEYDHIDVVLNALGSMGWELVSAVKTEPRSAHEAYRLFFKAPA